MNSSVPLVLEFEWESVTVTFTGYVPGVFGRHKIELVVELVQLSPEAKELQLKVTPPDPAPRSVAENTTD